MSTPLVLAIGKRGSGKSYFLREIVRATAANQMVVVDDPVGDWSKWGPWSSNVLIVPVEYNAFEVARHNAPCTLVLDELVLIAPSATSAQSLAVEIAITSRHLDIALLCATQRAALVSTTYQALVTHLAVFQVTLERDLAWIRSIQPDWRPEKLQLGQMLYTTM